MEDARYNNWIWAKKRKNDYGDSWEERAFAVDAARYVDVEDYTWPPRSYSCNFCAREFKSAQALGGHMNVHRRDRARLKQSSNPSIITNNNHQPLLPLPQKFSFIVDEETLPPSNIRVPKKNENMIKKSKFSFEDSWSNLVQENICFCATDLEINGEKRDRHDQLDKADLSSVNFDLVVEYSVSEDQDFINPTCKRRRILIDEPSLTLFPKSCCNKEELDLELRLGA